MESQSAYYTQPVLLMGNAACMPETALKPGQSPNNSHMLGPAVAAKKCSLYNLLIYALQAVWMHATPPCSSLVVQPSGSSFRRVQKRGRSKGQLASVNKSSGFAQTRQASAPEHPA